MSTSTQPKGHENMVEKRRCYFYNNYSHFLWNQEFNLGSIAFNKKRKSTTKAEQLKTDTARLNNQIIEMKEMNK
jgi:hypothetical protein